LGNLDANPFGNEDSEEDYYDEIKELNDSSVLLFKPVLGIEVIIGLEDYRILL
jgi:hypothetical protein